MLPALTPHRDISSEHLFTIAHRSPLLLAGEGVRPVAHDLIAHLLARHQRVVVADGSNRLDVHALVRSARRLRRPPAAFLKDIRISRAFTWQQYVALLERNVGPESARFGARWVLALGPLDLFADNDVKPEHAALGTRRTAEALAILARAGLNVIAAQEDHPLETGGRLSLLDRLKTRCETIVRVQPCTEPPPASEPLAGAVLVQG